MTRRFTLRQIQDAARHAQEICTDKTLEKQKAEK